MRSGLGSFLNEDLPTPLPRHLLQVHRRGFGVLDEDGRLPQELLAASDDGLDGRPIRPRIGAELQVLTPGDGGGDFTPFGAAPRRGVHRQRRCNHSRDVDACSVHHFGSRLLPGGRDDPLRRGIRPNIAVPVTGHYAEGR